MKRILYLIRRPPGIAADETTDLALVSCAFEQRASVLFLDDGVYQLVGLGARQSSLKALPTYDVQGIYAGAASLAARSVSLNADALAVRMLDDDAVRRLIAGHDHIVPD